jgi:hypothetical protein
VRQDGAKQAQLLNFEIYKKKRKRMKKMIKMSLVAAVAVAGLTTTASAKQNMAEWAKNTTLSGYVRYRLHNDLETDKQGDTTEEAKAVMKFTTPVNDMVTANLKYVSFAETKSANTTANTAVYEGNFVVKAGGATVIAGLQTSQSPFFANNGDTRSHGITALVPAGDVTIAGAYYYTTVAKGMVGEPAAGALANSVTALGALGKAGMVKYGVWYASVEDGADVEDVALTGVGLKSASATSIDVSADLGVANVQLMRTIVTNDSTDTGITKLVASGKAGAISWAAAYATTEKDGGMASLDNDSDSKADLSMHILNMGATTDATAMYAMGKMQINDKTCASLAYLSGTSDAHADFNEMDIKVGYKMSKNFSVSAIYGAGTKPAPVEGVAAVAAVDGTISGTQITGGTDAVTAVTAAPMADADFVNTRIEFKYTF